MVGWCRMDSRGSVVTACETVGSIKHRYLHNQLSNYYLLKSFTVEVDC